MVGMTASFRVQNQFTNLLFRGGTLDGHCERNTLKGGANKKIRERSGSLVGATPLLRFIGLEEKTPDRPLQMDPFICFKFTRLLT